MHLNNTVTQGGVLFIPACVASLVQPEFQETASKTRPHLLSKCYDYRVG